MLYTSLSRNQVLSNILCAIGRVVEFNVLKAHKLNDKTETCSYQAPFICHASLHDGTRHTESDVSPTVPMTKPPSFHFLKLEPKVPSTSYKKKIKSAQCDNDSSN